MTARFDLASEAGLVISSDAGDQPSGDDLVPAVNALYLDQLNPEDYGSDDDLEDSEETQATNLRSALLHRLSAIDSELREQLLEADRREYEENASILDHDLVKMRLDTLSSFALHLRKIGNNRASLLARLAEPLAEEHWLLDSGSHQHMVDTIHGMCELVNRLPSITAAAQHCLATDELPDSLRAGKNSFDIEKDC
ncbi:hypothetical protein GGI04_003470, partial [Coemansia thaxteri]